MTSPAAWASTWVGDTGWWLFCDINRQNIGSADAAVGQSRVVTPRRRQPLTGLVPAAVPYFVLQRHSSYVEASGLVLAATLGSASGSGLDRPGQQTRTDLPNPHIEKTMMGAHE